MQEAYKEFVGAEAEPELSRRAALITLARVENYNDLNADTEAEGDEIFKAKTRELWKELVVSGRVSKLNEHGEPVIISETDSDGRAALGILQLAGINTKNVKYIAPGGFEEGNIHIDVGNQDGVVQEVEVAENGVMQPTKTAFIDHHGPRSKSDTSATLLAYETVKSLGLLEATRELDRLVEFVTQVDNRSFPNEKNYFKDSYKTVWGLERFMSFEKLYDFFKTGKSPLEVLSPDEIKQMGLEFASKKQEKSVRTSLRELEEMKQKGFAVQSPKYGLIAVDVVNRNKKSVEGGFTAAKAAGYGGYVIWSPQNESFFVSTQKPFQHALPQGKPIRETMWIKPKSDPAPLSVKLGDLLKIITDGNLRPMGELDKYIRDEKKGIISLRS